MNARRWSLVAVLAVLLVLGISVGSASARKPAAIAAPNAAANVTTGAPGSVWFCPGPPDASTLAADRLTFANVGTTDATVVVTSRPDKGATAHTTYTVKAATVFVVARAKLGPLGALTVESFGGEVAVEEGLDDVARVAGGPCASNAATHWYFAAGTTPRGTDQWLVIDDPYATDARVDVALRTNDGILRPDVLQGLDIARRSRMVIPVHDFAVRKDRVAVEVDAELGKVVATQMITVANTGAAWTVGSPAASDDWTFAGARVVADRTTWVAIANVGMIDAQVTVQVVPSSAQVVAPATITVAQDDIVWVQLGGCPPGATPDSCVRVANGARYSVDVHADENAPIVAQMFGRGSTVVAAPLGTLTPAQTWVFPTSRVHGETETLLSFFDPQAAPATVNVAIVGKGRNARPQALQHVVVAPGRRLSIRVAGGRYAIPDSGALVVTSNIPVYADRTLTSTGDAAISAGIPVG